MKLTIELSDAHYRSLLEALEFFTRCGLGQFQVLADLHDTDDVLCDRRDRVADACKAILTPGMPRNGSYGIFSDKTPATCKRAWELKATLRHAVEPDGIWSREPMSSSGDPMPSVEVLP